VDHVIASGPRPSVSWMRPATCADDGRASRMDDTTSDRPWGLAGGDHCDRRRCREKSGSLQPVPPLVQYKAGEQHGDGRVQSGEHGNDGQLAMTGGSQVREVRQSGQDTRADAEPHRRRPISAVWSQRR
jgi:hypothetical protein